MTEQQINTIINIMNKADERHPHSAYVLQYIDPDTGISKHQGFTKFDRLVDFIEDCEITSFHIYR